MNVQEVAAQYGEYLIEKRRYFHQHPEVSTKEYHTSKAIKEALDEIGVSWRPCGLETGVLVTIQGAKPGKTILLRGDMDALTVQETTGAPYASKNEGIMHACGHDCHIAMLLTATRILHDMKEELCGTVKLAFQPAEEVALGANLPPPAAGGLRLRRPTRRDIFSFPPGAAHFLFDVSKRKWGAHPAWTMPPGGSQTPVAAVRRPAQPSHPHG